MSNAIFRASLAATMLFVSAHAFAIPFYAVTSNGTLGRFNTTSPSSAPTTVAITGIGAGESFIGIDIRPLDQKLYAITRDGANTGRLYTVNTTTGAATLIAPLTPNPIDAVPYSTLVGSHFGLSFNPMVDRMRLVTDAGENFRVVPTGIVTHDSDLNPGTPDIVAVAYINSFTGAATTTLYDIDAAGDVLMIQNPPNVGTLSVVGSLGVNFANPIAFDITTVGTTNFGYATALVGAKINFYSINLTTGAATLAGQLNGNFQAIGIAIVPDHLFANGFE